jgi:hypothetical protein
LLSVIPTLTHHRLSQNLSDYLTKDTETHDQKLIIIQINCLQWKWCPNCLANILKLIQPCEYYCYTSKYSGYVRMWCCVGILLSKRQACCRIVINKTILSVGYCWTYNLAARFLWAKLICILWLDFWLTYIFGHAV